MSGHKEDTQEIYEKRRMQGGKQAKEKIPMKPSSQSYGNSPVFPLTMRSTPPPWGTSLFRLANI